MSILIPILLVISFCWIIGNKYKDVPIIYNIRKYRSVLFIILGTIEILIFKLSNYLNMIGFLVIFMGIIYLIIDLRKNRIINNKK
jgi:predicted membrane channel-forming protein YqfA (hemolysin III family)